jgi:glycosyltransferase involved in cell wall biosynthesis
VTRARIGTPDAETCRIHEDRDVRPSAAMPPGPIRVAALIDTIQVSGPGRQLAALADHLAPAGVELLVVTFHRGDRPRAPYLDYLERAGVRYTLIPESHLLDVRLIPRLRRVLARWRPHIVQTHGYKPTALVYALRRTGATWPWIAFFHGATSENPKTKFYHWLDRRIMGCADNVVVMSRSHAADFSHLGGKVHVVYNAAIPLPPAAELRSPAPPLAAGFGGEIARPLVGVVGRLSPEKGVDLFLHACRELERRGRTVSAIVAGDGPERRNLTSLRDALGLQDSVHFVGLVGDLQPLYAELDVLVIPSRSEGLPNVLLEALRADVPVVATRVGAISEVLDSSMAGVLVPPCSPAALADGIAQALPLKVDLRSRAARRNVTERFSLESRCARHLELYHALLAREYRPLRARSGS